MSRVLKSTVVSPNKQDMEEKTLQKYTDGSQLDYCVTDDLIRDLQLLSVDTINESVMIDVIKKTGKEKEFLTVALQLSIGGFGGRDYAQYHFEGKDRELKTFFSTNGVKFNNQVQEKLKPDSLTPRRILRVFKSAISQSLLRRPDLSSYLYRKYTTQSAQYRHICFPGAEHLITKPDEIKYLLTAYQGLDKQLREAGKVSDIEKRIKRVFIARGLKLDTHN